MKTNLAFAFSLLTVFTTYAGEATSDESVMIEVKMSQTCFHNSQKSTNSGKLVGWKCDENDESQKFNLVDAGGEWFQLQHTKSGLCAEVKGASRRHHVSTVLSKCNLKDHQLWKINPIDNDWFTLSTKHTQGCLDLDHGVKRNGNRFIWQRCLKQSNKAWFDKQAFKIIKS